MVPLMLIVAGIIGIAWLGVATLVVGLCWAAKRGDERMTELEPERIAVHVADGGEVRLTAALRRPASSRTASSH